MPIDAKKISFMGNFGESHIFDYHTTDTQAEVFKAGYFNAIKRRLKVNDIIMYASNLPKSAKELESKEKIFYSGFLKVLSKEHNVIVDLEPRFELPEEYLGPMVL